MISEVFYAIEKSLMVTAVSRSKCNEVELIGPVCLKVKSASGKEDLGGAFPVE